MVNFLKYRKVTALSSLALIFTFIGVAIYRQQTRGSVYNYSVDFTGGTQVLLGFEQDVDGTQIKQIVADAGFVWLLYILVLNANTIQEIFQKGADRIKHQVALYLQSVKKASVFEKSFAMILLLFTFKMSVRKSCPTSESLLWRMRRPASKSRLTQVTGQPGLSSQRWPKHDDRN